MKKLWRGILLVVALILAVGVWVGLKVRDNLNGICQEVGRSLTEDEKKQRILDQINYSVALDNWKSEVSPYPKASKKFGLGIFSFKATASSYQMGHQDKFTENAKFENYSGYDNDNLKIYIYPDVPVNVRRSMFEIKVPVYKRVEFSGYGYRPVDSWYKITGYAYDLVYIKMNVKVDPGLGKQFSYMVQTNHWIDACGYAAPPPEEYIE